MTSSTQTVLVTGAGGFIGSHLVSLLAEEGWKIRAVVRAGTGRKPQPNSTTEIVEVPDMAEMESWDDIVAGCVAVIHLAARAHQVHESPTEGQDAFRRVNADATARLAMSAARNGVKRFVFVSSSGVMGDFSETAWTEEDVPQPQSAYAKSKLVAERELKAVAGSTAMDYVILRPALVYGPGNPGNLARLISLVASGLPLPLASIRSRRSLVDVLYFVKVIQSAVTLPSAANQTYLVADGNDVSISEIVRDFAAGLGRPARLVPFPASILKMAAKLLGKEQDVRRLTGSFLLNASKMRRDFGISPNRDVHKNLALTARSSA